MATPSFCGLLKQGTLHPTSHFAQGLIAGKADRSNVIGVLYLTLCLNNIQIVTECIFNAVWDGRPVARLTERGVHVKI